MTMSPAKTAEPIVMPFGMLTRVDSRNRSKRCALCPPDLMTFEQLLEEADQQHFNKLYNKPGRARYGSREPAVYYTIVMDIDNSSGRIIDVDSYSVINCLFSASVARPSVRQDV